MVGCSASELFCGDLIVQQNEGEVCDSGQFCEDGTVCINDTACAGIGDQECMPRPEYGL